MGDFIQDIESEDSPEWDGTVEKPVPDEKQLPAVIPPGMQLIETEKLRSLLEMAKQFQAIAHEKSMRLDDVSGDIQSLINGMVSLLDVTGLNELFDGKEDPPDKWTLIAKMISLIKTLYREKDNPDSELKRIGSDFVHFLRKYGNPENFDEHEQFISFKR